MKERFKQQVDLCPKNLKKVSLLVIQFIGDCFSKKVKSENHFKYIFSAYIADKFLNKIENDKINALYYPGVPGKLNSENLAIKPTVFDELYDPWG